MPWKRPQSPLAQAVLPVVAGVVLFGLLGLGMWGIASVLTHNRKVELRLGDRYFDAGQFERVAKQFTKNGPVIYPGLVGGADERPIAITHTGTDARHGWHVVELVPPGAAHGCLLSVDRTTHELTAPCSPVRYPSDGTGLSALATDKVTIDPSDHLIIDLTTSLTG